MAQQRRMVYGKMFGSNDLNQLSVQARYLYVGLVVLADDDGRINGHPRYLKGQIFSYDDEITSEMVKKWRDELVEKNQIHLYQFEGNEYLNHQKWKEYQAIRSDMYVTSKLPKPPRVRNEAVTEVVHKLSKVKLSKVKKESNAVESEIQPFVWTEYLKKMDNDSREAVQLLAYFFRKRKIEFTSIPQAQEAIRRHIKAANKAVNFEKHKVLAAIDKCATMHKDVDWSLETVLKKLTN